VGAPDGEKDLEEDLDAGWDDDEEEDDEDLEELDSGWEDVEPQGGDAAPDAQRRPRKKRDVRPARELTPEELAAREARAAARKERHRAKAAEKAERRKARASTAAAKQKKSLPRERTAKPTTSVRPPPSPVEDEDAEEIRAGSRVSVAPAPVAAPSRSPKWLDGRTIALAVLVLLVGGAIAFVLTRR
jgi:cobalamin biosynthesis Mg chelatase CobN